jgi:hypothetical protein
MLVWWWRCEEELFPSTHGDRESTLHSTCCCGLKEMEFYPVVCGREKKTEWLLCFVVGSFWPYSCMMVAWRGRVFPVCRVTESQHPTSEGLNQMGHIPLCVGFIVSYPTLSSDGETENGSCVVMMFASPVTCSFVSPILVQGCDVAKESLSRQSCDGESIPNRYSCVSLCVDLPCQFCGCAIPCWCGRDSKHIVFDCRRRCCCCCCFHYTRINSVP